MFLTRIDFAAGKQSASVTIGNKHVATLTLQPSAVRWQQIAGEEQQEPTRDVLTAPPLWRSRQARSRWCGCRCVKPSDATGVAAWLAATRVPPADK